MPIIKSAKKRVKVAAKARSRNARYRRALRDTMKAFNKAVESGKATDIQKTQIAAVSALDVAVKKEIIHRNKAARQKSSLSVKAKAAGVKPGKADKKPAAKSVPTPKKTAKKTTSKKPTPKKALK